MKDIEKGLLIGFAIQLGIIFIIILDKAILSRLDITLLQISMWQIPIIFFTNMLGCGLLFGKPFRKNLKKIPPDEYEDLTSGDIGFLTTNTLKYAGFAFWDSVEDTEETKKLKMYLRLGYLLYFIIFIETVVISIVY